VERSGRFELRLGAGGETFDVLSVAQGTGYLVEVDGAVHRISGGEASSLAGLVWHRTTWQHKPRRANREDRL